MFAHPPGGKTGDDAGVERRLMQRHSQRSRLIVPLRDQRICRRRIKRLAEAGGKTSKEDQSENPRTDSGKKRPRTPHKQHDDNDPFATENIADISSQRNHGAVDPGEDCSYERQAVVRDLQVFLDERKQVSVNLAIGLVKKKRDPKQAEHLPLIGQEPVAKGLVA